MKRDATPNRPIWLDRDPRIVNVIDQRQLPHRLVVAPLKTVDEMIYAIQEMFVRGAPLIGVSGAYGAMLAAIAACDHGDPEGFFQAECARLKAARPTAVNLAWAVERALAAAGAADTPEAKVELTRALAVEIAEEEVENCRRIGEHGVELIRALSEKKGGDPVNVLTHCNAGWLACVEWGTATAPVYAAFEADIEVHVWVDETRPLNQGARLTAWELGQKGVPHTVITDNAGGHLMQHGMVDLVIVGTDRTTHTGDVANKIGTYLKALAARDNEIPFYVALPSSTFDWELRDGLAEIPIEERDPDEIRYVHGLVDGETHGCSVLVPPAQSPAANYAFDVTPARLVTGFITERGICGASEAEIHRLFPEK
jgi:methylthioribose-1-phosphate isomerase